MPLAPRLKARTDILSQTLDQSRFYKDSSATNSGRRNDLQEIVRPELFDRLMDVCQMFMAGP
jgi:hypothetical protein